tara:strand:- start:54 stop:1166 length:1113 start_codon:yes stop_codon:yes gene_type:complete
MENNDEKAKEDFLLRSVDSNETTDTPSSNSKASKATPNNKNNDSKDSKSFNKVIKNLIFLILIVVSVFYVSKSCNRDKTSYYESALESFNSGNTENGFDDINEAIEMDNQYGDALLLRAKQYMEIEEYQDAEYDLTELINLDEKNWKTYYLRGKSYIGQATSKYSSSYEKAIKDFTTSIALESGSKNMDSYYLRGDCKEILLGEYSGCADFNYACILGNDEGCDRYSNLCYPKTGFMPYEKYFGKGVHSGQNTLYVDNTKSSFDALVVIQNRITKINIRCQFIRKGEDLTFDNIPYGNYWVKDFTGNNWTFDELMSDSITKGGFTLNKHIGRSKWEYPKTNSIWNGSMTLYKTEGGSLQSEEIDFNEFMN